MKSLMLIKLHGMRVSIPKGSKDFDAYEQLFNICIILLVFTIEESNGIFSSSLKRSSGYIVDNSVYNFANIAFFAALLKGALTTY